MSAITDIVLTINVVVLIALAAKTYGDGIMEMELAWASTMGRMEENQDRVCVALKEPNYV